METKHNYPEIVKNIKTVKDIKNIVKDYKKEIQKIDKKYDTEKFEKELNEVEEKINYQKSFIEKLEFEGAELNKELIDNAKNRLEEALEKQKSLNEKIENSKLLANVTVKLESGREVSQKEKDNMDKMDLKTKTVAILTQKNKNILEDLSKKQKKLEEKTAEWNKLYTTHDPEKDHAQHMQSLNKSMDKLRKDISDLNEMKKVCDESLRELNEPTIEEKRKIEDLSKVLNRTSNLDDKEANVEKQKENVNKENAQVVEKTKNTNSVELDEFLNAKSSNEKPEKENDIKYVDFNEFFGSKKDEKAQEEPKKVELDEESKIIAVAGRNADGFIKYEHVNEETKKIRATNIYSKTSYKKCYNEYRTMGFDNGTIEFDAEALKNLDPLLLKYLEDTNNDLAFEVAKKISNHEDLSEYKDLIKYDMTEADKLSWKHKRICRKIAKTAQRNGLEVENISATKGFWTKLLDKILVRDDDYFFEAAKETKELEAGESENKKAMNEFKEQLGQQVKDMLKEENSIDTKKEDEELTAEAEKSIKNAMEARKANIEDLNKDEDENER